MSDYEATVVLDGWFPLRLKAGNRAEAAQAVRSASFVHLELLDHDMRPIGRVLTSKTSGALFTLEVETDNVKQVRSEERLAYHEPASINV